ncbi:MAG: HAMP domain-containing sensor histidine kinase [Hyphomicrobiaceae bacterium]|nr:HAMP domain-containing sensor histidine kinase [Hyphomicrobiaceae bacterium]
MDDAAILREIARRIRDGMDGSPSAAVPAIAPDALESTSEARERDLIARLAHELKSPLSAMVAAAEVMAEERLGPIANVQYLGYAADIATSGRHALTVVDRVLQDWRQPGKPASLEFVQLDLNKLIERTASVLRPIVRERNQTIRTDLAPGLPHLIADATSIRQILLNLLNNAAKYANPDSEIVITTSYRLDGPVELEIADAGPGLSPDEIAYALGETATPVAVRGTGLGLPLVRKLAAANGATMVIDSSKGSPTRIKLKFAKDKVVPV